MNRLLMRNSAGILGVILLLLFPSTLCYSLNEDKLETVLNLMEKANRNFQSFKSSVSTKKYTAVLDEFDPAEKGTFIYKKDKDGSALIRWEVNDPASKILTIQKDKAIVYQPKIATAHEYRLGKKKDMAEFVALGIGQSPKDLKKTFDIRYIGTEKLEIIPQEAIAPQSKKAETIDCSVLELEPKNPETAAMFSSITVWINNNTGVSTKMKLDEPMGDYLIVDFWDETLNEKIDNSLFEQKLSKKVEVISISVH